MNQIVQFGKRRKKTSDEMRPADPYMRPYQVFGVNDRNIGFTTMVATLNTVDPTHCFRSVVDQFDVKALGVKCAMIIGPRIFAGDTGMAQPAPTHPGGIA